MRIVDLEAEGASSAEAQKAVHEIPSVWAEVIDLAYLPGGARPVPYAELEYDEVPQARLLDCGRYNDCLNFVARVRWRGFSCRRCPHRTDQAEQGDAGEERATGLEAEATNAAIIRLR